MNYQLTIAEILGKVLAAEPLNVEISTMELEKLLEVPKDANHGDWAFPCFMLAKQLKKAPQQIAEQLAEGLQSKIEDDESLTGVSAIGPYVNFAINETHLANQLLPTILNGGFLAVREHQAKKVLVEYSQPNTHKAFHVGHIRCAALGDSVARILKWKGYEVVQANYIGDEGTHVARCLWFFMKHFKGDVPNDNLGEFLGMLYTRAVELLDLGLMTAVPYPGVVVARIIDKSDHPSKAEWFVYNVDTGSEVATVVSIEPDLQVGQLIPYAKPGTKLSDRTVGVVDKEGVQSTGMICAEKELGLSDTNRMPELAGEPPLGTELVELFRNAEVVPDGTLVLAEKARRDQEVSEVLQKMERGDGEVGKLWEETKEWSMQEFYRVYEWLRCHFDHYFYESECGEPSKEMVRQFQEKGVFVESDGAVGADLNDWGLGFCLLLKRDGTAIYATRDLALAQMKFEEFGIDRSIYVVDCQQTLHFQQVFKCLELMGFEQAKDCHHLAYERVVRPDGDMGSRKGNVILFSELKALLIEKITSEFLDKYRGEWPDEEIDDAAYKVSLATMRYGMLNQDHNSRIVFDLDEWTARTGNTGPYLMYAFARIQSILREVKPDDAGKVDWSLLTDPTEVTVIKHLASYHENIERAYRDLLPMALCVYLYELSKKFSSMYKQCSVLKAETAELQTARASLIQSVAMVLEHGLDLLGIPVIRRM